jgi:hypothetical protein
MVLVNMMDEVTTTTVAGVMVMIAIPVLVGCAAEFGSEFGI